MTIPLKPSLQLVAIQKALYSVIREQLVAEVPGEQIIWRNQSEPLPPRPCVTMKIIDGPRRTGYQDSMVYLQGAQFNLGGQRVMTISIQVFGNTQIHRPLAYQLAKDLNASLSKPTVLDKLRAAGIAVWNQGEPSNLTALEETEYEERAQFDVTLGVAENVVDDPGIIESANITPNVD